MKIRTTLRADLALEEREQFDMTFRRSRYDTAAQEFRESDPEIVVVKELRIWSSAVTVTATIVGVTRRKDGTEGRRQVTRGVDIRDLPPHVHAVIGELGSVPLPDGERVL